MKETWAPIDGFVGYEISSLGRARSKWRRITERGQKGWRYELSDEFTYLNPSTHRQGYLRFDMYHEGKKHCRYAHRLVAIAFLPNPDGKPEVNHLNGVKADCSVENLEWSTRGDNQRHAISAKLIRDYRRGPRVPDEIRKKIVKMLENGHPQTFVARFYGLNRRTVGRFSSL